MHSGVDAGGRGKALLDVVWHSVDWEFQLVTLLASWLVSISILLVRLCSSWKMSLVTDQNEFGDF